MSNSVQYVIHLKAQSGQQWQPLFTASETFSSFLSGLKESAVVAGRFIDSHCSLHRFSAVFIFLLFYQSCAFTAAQQITSCTAWRWKESPKRGQVCFYEAHDYSATPLEILYHPYTSTNIMHTDPDSIFTYLISLSSFEYRQ